jgi:hypothetical protein
MIRKFSRNCRTRSRWASICSARSALDCSVSAGPGSARKAARSSSAVCRAGARLRRVSRFFVISAGGGRAAGSWARAAPPRRSRMRKRRNIMVATLGPARQALNCGSCPSLCPSVRSGPPGQGFARPPWTAGSLLPLSLRQPAGEDADFSQNAPTCGRRRVGQRLEQVLVKAVPAPPASRRRAPRRAPRTRTSTAFPGRGRRWYDGSRSAPCR